MTAWLVIDAAPHQPVAAVVRGGDPPRVDAVTTLAGDLTPNLAAGCDRVVHRLRHAPPGAAEVTATLDPAAVRAAGRHEPADTAARLAGWDAAARLWPRLPARAVFDDAWFAALPEPARTPALPPAFTADHELRRRGAHGPVHRLAAAQTGAARVVSVLLGPESSVAAVRGGQPVETSAGATLLEGVPGGRTCGDVDPAVVLFLVDRLRLPLDAVERALQADGGLQGLSGGCATANELLAAHDDAAALAIRHLIHRVRRQIGAQTAVLAGLDALVFSAGDGFDDPALREQIVAGLAYLGLGDRVPVLTTSLTPLLATALVAGA